MQAEEIKNAEERIIADSDGDAVLGNGDVSSSVDVSLEDQSTGISLSC